MKKELSLYIHIPFCSSKCDYCDFYSKDIKNISHGGAAAQRKYIKYFLDLLIQDIKEQVEESDVKLIPTIYIGGGTPSVLGADIKILLDALNNMSAFKPEEFTIEANPESLTEGFLAVCKAGGVNRLSLGVQTFYEPSRVSVNRAGGAVTVENALSLAKKYFPYDLSVDLITGFPFHTEDIVKEDIKRILDFDPAHVSVYSLTLEEGTLLYGKQKKGSISLPDKDTSDALWLTARDTLLNAGFKHYEVSNFARKTQECKHNIRYWRMQSWLGAGPSASGTIIDEKTRTAMRYTYAKDVEEYVNKIAGSNEQLAISNEQLLREIIMMGYRYCEGPDPKWEVEKYIPKTLEKWKNKDKMLFLNSFLNDAFKEMENKIYANRS